MSEQLERITVSESASIREAVKRMDAGGQGFILCIDGESKVTGLMTDGDFRRAVLGNISLEQPVVTIMNREFRSLRTGYEEQEVRALFSERRLNIIPVLDEQGRLAELIPRSQSSGRNAVSRSGDRYVDAQVVIMAGGKGTRLKPYTQILPKPLIPIGDKPIIEIIMDNFARFGMRTFQVSVNYKARMIRAYFEDRESPYGIHFFDEPMPLGTAGSLKYLEGKLTGPTFVTNCDILVEADYPSILEYHRTNGFDFTMVASMQHQRIPYGICEIADGGELLAIREKPELDFLVNTGFYVLNPSTLGLIPQDTPFDMTDFLAELRKNRARIGVFPISQNAWIDTGQMQQLNHAFHRLGVNPEGGPESLS